MSLQAPVKLERVCTSAKLEREQRAASCTVCALPSLWADAMHWEGPTAKIFPARPAVQMPVIY